MNAIKLVLGFWDVSFFYCTIEVQVEVLFCRDYIQNPIVHRVLLYGSNTCSLICITRISLVLTYLYKPTLLRRLIYIYQPCMYYVYMYVDGDILLFRTGKLHRSLGQVGELLKAISNRDLGTVLKFSSYLYLCCVLLSYIFTYHIIYVHHNSQCNMHSH